MVRRDIALKLVRPAKKKSKSEKSESKIELRREEIDLISINDIEPQLDNISVSNVNAFSPQGEVE